MRVFLKYYDPEEGAATELTGINITACSKAMWGQGLVTFTKRDKELTNYTTLIEYLWRRIEVKTDDLAAVLWEGFITDIGVNFNEVTYTCKEAVGILDHHISKHSSIISHGTVTSLGANYITDSNAAFVSADVNTKGCLFTDANQPSIDIIYPNSNSLVYTHPGEDVPSTIIGTYTSVKPVSGSWFWWKIDTDSYLKGGNGFEFYYTLPHAADTTKIVFYFDCIFKKHKYYSIESERPWVEVYDDTNAVWRGITDANDDISGEGYLTSWADNRYFKKFGVTISANISNYTDGSDQVRIRIRSGDPNANSPQSVYTQMHVRIAKCTATYETLFDTAAATAYTIDNVPSATRLDFTGQNPDGDGVGEGDSYRIGDLVSTVIADLFQESEEAFLTVEVEASTEIDATDYWYIYLGTALRSLAARDGRYYWQKIGWTFRSYTTKIATGLTINQANVITSVDNLGWTYHVSGNEIYSSVLVAGANNEVFMRNYSVAYPSPLSLIVTDQSITTESAAYWKASVLCLLHDTPKKHLTTIIDYDASDWSALDIGKTITVDLYNIDFTALIVGIQHHQVHGGNQMTTLILEAV